MDLSFSITRDAYLWIFIIFVLIATAVISGIYPAFYISSFNPVNHLQDKLKLGRSNLFSKTILTLQFGITALALFTGIAFIQNVKYQENFDLGYDGDYLIQVDLNHNYLDVFDNAMQRYPEIESVCKSVQGPFFNTRSLKYGEIRQEAKMNFLEMESFNTMGFRLLEGRSFELETEKTDEISSILVNREFIEESGLNEPVGKILIMSDSVPLTIIGVIENVLDEGVFTTEISPIFYRLVNDSCKAGGLWIRVAPENRQEVYQFLKDEWNNLVPDIPFFGIEGDIYTLASQHISKNILTISFFLALIAILLSAAGLYSQISLRIIHRTKEIGIRKVFGTTVSGVIKKLNYEFLVVLTIGSSVGTMAAYYLNGALMDSIWEYFTDLTALTFIMPVIIIFTISVITISGKVYFAATRNPAHSLRYE